MHIVPLLFGLLCGLAVWCSMPDAGTRRLAAMLVIYWGAANLLWQANALWALPAMDLAIGIEARSQAVFGGGAWLDRIAGLVGVRLALHVFDALTASAWQVPYLHALNFTFMLMLITLVSRGGGFNGGNIDRCWRRIRGVLPALQAEAR